MPHSRSLKNTVRGKGKGGGKGGGGGTATSKTKAPSKSTYRSERSAPPAYIDPSGITPLSPRKGGARMVADMDLDRE